eukprot:NODE_14039_length_236_cov_1.569061.p4 GENE.NODE_14039_length_236_cov_1.569061~~NODE_14039_length_236_cov_1.569061.p4  ORF type:complete len:57 (+),score=2.49 NODE_14039_length_236_cov_1.569061:45-215(+)
MVLLVLWCPKKRCIALAAFLRHRLSSFRTRLGFPNSLAAWRHTWVTSLLPELGKVL